PNPLEYGVVVVDEGGLVQRFIEKPSWGEVISDLANTGIYILDPAVFDFFRPGEVTDWSGDVFPKLLKQGEPVYGWIASGYWVDGPCVVGGFTTIDSGAKVSNSITWDHAYIGENSRLRGTVVCRSVTIKNGCLLEEGSVIGSDVVIGAGSTVNANVRIWPNKE